MLLSFHFYSLSLSLPIRMLFSCHLFLPAHVSRVQWVTWSRARVLRMMNLVLLLVVHLLYMTRWTRCLSIWIRLQNVRLLLTLRRLSHVVTMLIPRLLCLIVWGWLII